MPGRPETQPDTRAAPLRERLYVILEAGKTGDRASAFFDGFMVALILANVVAFAAETDVAFAAEHGRALALFDTISILIFTVEYLLRIWVCVEHPPLRDHDPWTVRWRWVRTPSMLIDLAVIAPFYLAALFTVDLRVLRIFRLLRFLKLARYSPALVTLGAVVYAERRAILGAIIVMVGLLLSSAYVMYLLERHIQPDAFGSVPRAMWWALATLTTVGYGDVVPVTLAGKLFGGLVMVFGLGMFALPIAIISGGFAQEIHRREFVISWGMVARVPIFQGLRPIVLADLLDYLQSQIVEAGTVIAHRGDVADGMYFIVAGRVDVQLNGNRVELGEGEFFGEMALLDQRRRSATIVAGTRAHLLKLDAHDFTKFIEHHGDAKERISAVAAMRRSKTDEIAREIHEEKKPPETGG